MTQHSTNDTELFRKMTSLILMGKISPPGHCHTVRLRLYMNNIFLLGCEIKLVMTALS